MAEELQTLLKKARFSSSNSSRSFCGGLSVAPFSVSILVTADSCLNEELELESLWTNPPTQYTSTEAAKNQAGSDTRLSNGISIMLQAAASRPAAKQLRFGLHSREDILLIISRAGY